MKKTLLICAVLLMCFGLNAAAQRDQRGQRGQEDQKERLEKRAKQLAKQLKLDDATTAWFTPYLHRDARLADDGTPSGASRHASG